MLHIYANVRDQRARGEINQGEGRNGTRQSWIKELSGIRDHEGKGIIRDAGANTLLL